MKIAIVLGTRPEIIKLSPIIRYFQENNVNFILIHTNQHFSSDMDKIFFKELDLPEPHFNLHAGGLSHAKQTAQMLVGIEEIFLSEKPDCVIVQGDTNSVLSGALVASKMNIKVAHVEAGLRSYDRAMPEELNRLMTDDISDFLFVPTETQKNILLSEKKDSSFIYETGNTIVDAVSENALIAKKKSNIIQELNLDDFCLLTMHRPSNVDNKDVLSTLISSIEKLADIRQTNIVFPIHPRTKNNMEKFGLQFNSHNIIQISPVGYLDMISLMSSAKLILTDSGGIQEEACILHTPTITLRSNTERPETLDVGSNVLLGNNYDSLINLYDNMIAKKPEWKIPFGNNPSKKICDILLQKIDK